MLNAVRPSSPKAVEGAQQPIINDRILEEKISKINATQLELLGWRLASQILHNLGKVAKARIEPEVAQKKGAPLSEAQLRTLEMGRMAAEKEVEISGIEFLSGSKSADFITAMLSLIKNAISKNFSTPSQFLTSGLDFKLSEHNPEGILAETAKKIRIDINMNQVPIRYYIHLRIDKALSQQQSKLVFSFTEESDGVEFDKHTFTVEQLEQDFMNGFSSE